MTASSDFYCLAENVYVLKAGPLSLKVDRLRRERHELVGELEILVFPPGGAADGVVVSLADFNLSSLRSRQDRAKFLKEHAGVSDFEYYAPIEVLCQKVLAAERAGQPAIHLRDVPYVGPADIADIDGIKIPIKHTSCGFGDGGGLKSLLFGLHLGGRLAEHGFKVLYCDWEFSAADHRDRFGRLFPVMPDVLYRRCERPLTVEADSIRRVVRAEQIDFVICDSVVFACDGPPESAETAAAYFRAVRSFGVGSLHIAHVNRSQECDKKPFGSTFWHNGFRTTWFIERQAESPDAEAVTVGVFNRKNNVGPIAPAVGFEVEFSDDRIHVQRVDIAGAADFAGRVATWQRMASALKRGPLTIAALAEEIGAKPETIKKTVDRSVKKNGMFVRIPGPDGTPKIGLAARRVA